LLFSSDRSGELATWRVALADGHVPASPVLVRRSGPRAPRGLTATGQLFSELDNKAGAGVKIATFDFSTGTFSAAPKDVSETFVRSTSAPRWSPDGKTLGYMLDRGVRGSHFVLVLLSVDTGASRELPLNFFPHGQNSHRWQWMPDSRSIVVQGENPRDPGPKEALHRIDTVTGDVSPLVPDFPHPMQFAGITWSTDGRTLLYSRPDANHPDARVSHDIATGVERELEPDAVFALRSPDGTKAYVTRPAGGRLAFFERDTKTGEERHLMDTYGSGGSLAPDGRSILAPTRDLSTAEGLIVQYMTADGATKVVFRGARGRDVSIDLLAPDSRSIVVRSPNLTNTNVFWWVPLDGRQPRELRELTGVNPIERAGSRAFELHPDGKRIAFGTAYERTIGDQLFVLENFLPPAKR